MIVYVCSPLRAYCIDDHRGRSRVEVADNIEAAKRYSRATSLLGHFPLAPHLLLTQFLDDEIASERQLGIRLGLEILAKCDVIWVFGPYLSGGMRAEIARAAELGVLVAWWREGLPGAIQANRAAELPAKLTKR